MAFTKAVSPFLTNKSVVLYSFLIFFTISLLSNAVHACGGSYTEWYDIGEPLVYDPDRASLKNSIQIFQDFTRPLRENNNPWLHFEEKGARYYSDITDALRKSNRQLIDGGSFTAHSALERTYKAILFPNINHGKYDSRELCGTRDITSLQRFVTLVINDNSVSDVELAKIFSIRSSLSKSCYLKSALENTLSRLASPDNYYEMYLQATAYFYLKDYEKAGAAFALLSKASDNPLAEISSYLRGRTALFASQKDWPEWPDSFEGINRQDAMTAITLFNTYLDTYPDGRYAASARGLIRRAYWLLDDDKNYKNNLFYDTQTSALSMLNEPEWNIEKAARVDSLINELYRYGGFDSDDDKLSILQLVFKKYNPDSHSSTASIVFNRMYEYLHLFNKYSNGDYGAVIEKLSSYKKLNNVEAILMARALEKNKQYDKAITVWQEYKDRPYTEFTQANVEIARITFRQHGLIGLFSQETPISEPLKRLYLGALCDDQQQLTIIKDPDIDAENRHIIFADLATRYLYFEQFNKLNKLLSRHKKDTVKEFGAIRTAVRDIVQKKHIGRAYMNIGFFMETEVYTPIYEIPGRIYTSDTAECKTQPLKSNTIAGPFYYFNKSLAYFDSRKNQSEAKALHFITFCGKQGSETRRCRWGQSQKDALTSQQAFKRLHDKYPKSKWARKTPYHFGNHRIY